jgi:hypothetical protein
VPTQSKPSSMFGSSIREPLEVAMPRFVSLEDSATQKLDFGVRARLGCHARPCRAGWHPLDKVFWKKKAHDPFGAIAMSKPVPQKTERKEHRELAEKIEATQSKERQELLKIAGE